MARHHALWPLLGALLLGLLAAPAPARARSVVAYSEPADGAVLRVAPHTLQIWFDSAAIIEPGAVTLADADGADLAIPAASSDIYRPDDAGLADLFDPSFLFLCSLGLNSYPTTLTVSLPELGPGTYRLSWRAIAIKDRRASSGTLVFAVDPEAPPAADSADARVSSFTSLADDLMVSMAVRPNRPGANFISLRAAALRRPLRAPIEGVTVRLTSPDGLWQDISATRGGDGTFQIAGGMIDRPGTWRADLYIGRGRIPATVATIAWDVPDSSAGPPTPWIVAALGGLALASGLFAVARRRNS